MRTPHALVSGLLILGGTTLPAVFASATATVPAPHHSPTPSATHAPQLNLEYTNSPSAQWVPSSWTGTRGSAPAERTVTHASVQFASAAPLRGATLTFTTSGPVRLVTPRTVRIGTLRAFDPARYRIAFEVYADGSGGIQVELAGTAADGAALRYSSPLNFATGSRHVAFATNGLLSAQANALRLEEPALGGPLYRERLAALEGGGATTTFSEAHGPSATPKTTTVHGVIDYQDRNGNKHPCRDIYVQVYDDVPGAAADPLVASTTTNPAGSYSVTVATLRSNGTARSLYVQPLAADAGFQIVLNIGDKVPQHLDSVDHTANGATQTVDMVANNTADNNTAFDVADMLVTGDAYVLRIHNNRPFPRISASYPNPKGTDFMPGSNTAEIVQGDRFDWDVVLHEFGHYVAANLGIDTSKGGNHKLSQNLGEPSLYGKNLGIRLAWSEGFATWFSLTAQYEEKVAAMHIPYAGDWSYEDTEDANIEEPINVNTAAVPSLGEDNEVSVARILYHVLIDPAIKMTDTAIINALVAAKATTLSTATAVLMKADGAAAFGNQSGTVNAEKKMNAFGCMLTTQVVSPQIELPGANAVFTAASPTSFTWQPNGAGPSNRLNQSNLQFWSPTWGKLLWTSPQITTPANDNLPGWTPTQAQWNALMAQTDENNYYPSKMNVVVVGSDINAPVTGPYGSCAVPVSVSQPTVAVTPADSTDNVIVPIPSAFSGGLNPLIDQFVVNASGLEPSTYYSLSLYNRVNGYGPVTQLTPSTTPAAPNPPNSVITDSNGNIVNADITIPDMPADANWPLTLTPLGTQGQAIPGRIGTTTMAIGWDTVGEVSAASGPALLYWGGAGVEPNTPVTFTWDSGTPNQVTSTVTSLADGEYYYNNTSPGPSGPLNVVCTGSDTITVDAITYNGPSELGGTFNCAQEVGGPNRGGGAIAHYFFRRSG